MITLRRSPRGAGASQLPDGRRAGAVFSGPQAQPAAPMAIGQAVGESVTQPVPGNSIWRVASRPWYLHLVGSDSPWIEFVCTERVLTPHWQPLEDEEHFTSERPGFSRVPLDLRYCEESNCENTKLSCEWQLVQEGIGKRSTGRQKRRVLCRRRIRL